MFKFIKLLLYMCREWLLSLMLAHLPISPRSLFLVLTKRIAPSGTRLGLLPVLIPATQAHLGIQKWFFKNEETWNNRNYNYSKRCRSVAGYHQNLAGIRHPTFSFYGFCSTDFLTLFFWTFHPYPVRFSGFILSNMSVTLLNNYIMSNYISIME